MTLEVHHASRLEQGYNGINDVYNEVVPFIRYCRENPRVARIVFIANILFTFIGVVIGNAFLKAINNSSYLVSLSETIQSKICIGLLVYSIAFICNAVMLRTMNLRSFGAIFAMSIACGITGTVTVIILNL